MATKESKSTRGTKIIVFLEVLSTQVPCYSFKSFRVMQQFVSWGSILSSLGRTCTEISDVVCNTIWTKDTKPTFAGYSPRYCIPSSHISADRSDMK